ncbi:MAG TPA: hypothetical protein VFM56_10655 [Solimonas sp.]|nr:hypothetical protein [Solimonas sp.]
MSAVEKCLKPEQPREIDREAVAGVVRAMLATDDAKRKLSDRLAAAELRQIENARSLGAMIGSLSGFVIDGYSVAVHSVPGKPPIVNIRPVRVL